MSRKKIEIRPKKAIEKKNLPLDIEKKLDQWVSGGSESTPTPLPPQPQEKPSNKDDETFRFTVVLPKYLHRRIKKMCAVRGVKMKDAITDVLEVAFPEN